MLFVHYMISTAALTTTCFFSTAGQPADRQLLRHSPPQPRRLSSLELSLLPATLSRAPALQLVNLQTASSFDTHRLNRDVWRNDMVRDLVANNFVFYQVRAARRAPDA